jgi:hypothetical protein
MRALAGYRDVVSSVVIEATITCPECGMVQRESMPTDACVFFWTCSGCEARVRPLPGDCCVFCSYSDAKCPPKQGDQACAC